MDWFNPFGNATGSGGGGTSDYNNLTNKPKINSVPLVGDQSLQDLGAVGKNVEGTEYTIDDEQVVAQAGAEIFNIGKIEEAGYVLENDNKATGFFSHAEGFGTQAIGDLSHTEGGGTNTVGDSSHAEGSGTIASGWASHAEGIRTKATSDYSHAEGEKTTASGEGSHAEGQDTQATEGNSHAEGYATIAAGYNSHAEGNHATASGNSSHAEGFYTTATGRYSHAEGNNTVAAGENQHVQGKYNVEDANDKYAFIIGNGTDDQNRSNAFAVDWDGKVYVNGDANGVDLSKSVGKNVTGIEYTIDGETVVAQAGAEIFNNYKYNEAAGENSHAEGFTTKAVGRNSHAEGGGTKATGNESHAEGSGTQAIGLCSHAEGSGARATGQSSHAEGGGTQAAAQNSHSEGGGTTASGDYSHSEGGGTRATGQSSHAEGGGTTASGVSAHSEGNGTTASGDYSHSEGNQTKAISECSHAEGDSTLASSECQHVQGKYNVEDTNDKYAFIIGNGTDDQNRSNAFAIDWDGNIYQNNSNVGVNLADQQKEIDYAINTGTKNLLPMTHAGGSITRYGVTCTWDLDSGTMTLNGTHSDGDSAAIFEFYDGSAEATTILPVGTYVLTGCPAGGSTATYRAVLTQIAGAVDVGNGVNFKLSEPHYAAYRILISGNVTFNNMVFKPMIRPASITDDTFVPYALSNSVLTPAVIKVVDGGAKNLVNAPSGSGVRFINIPIVLQPGDYYVKFQNITSTDTGASVCQFGAFAEDNSQASGLPQLKRGDDTGAMFTVTKQTSYVRLYASSSYAGGEGDTVTFTGCMICTAADYAISPAFVPYAPTNGELYEACETKVTMQQAYGDAILIPANSDLNTYTTPGIYYTVVANVPTILNTPYTSTGLRLVVEKNTLTASAIFQTIYPTSRLHLEFFRRVYEGNEWSNWYKFEGTPVTT